MALYQALSSYVFAAAFLSTTLRSKCYHPHFTEEEPWVLENLSRLSQVSQLLSGIRETQTQQERISFHVHLGKCIQPAARSCPAPARGRATRLPPKGNFCQSGKTEPSQRPGPSDPAPLLPCRPWKTSRPLPWICDRGGQPSQQPRTAVSNLGVERGLPSSLPFSGSVLPLP